MLNYPSLQTQFFTKCGTVSDSCPPTPVALIHCPLTPAPDLMFRTSYEWYPAGCRATHRSAEKKLQLHPVVVPSKSKCSVVLSYGKKHGTKLDSTFSVSYVCLHHMLVHFEAFVHAPYYETASKTIKTGNTLIHRVTTHFRSRGTRIESRYCTVR